MSAKANRRTTDPPVVVVHDPGTNNDSSPPPKKRARETDGRDHHDDDGPRRRIPPPRGGGGCRVGGTRSFRPDSTALLDDMLHPMSVDEFLDSHFRNNAVHVNRRGLTRGERVGMVGDICENYLFGLDVRRIFEETSSENVFLWLRHPLSPSSSSSAKSSSSLRPPPPPPPLDSVEISDPSAAYKLHVSGNHPAYCRAPPRLERLLVSSLLRSTGLGGGHYYPPHNHDNDNDDDDDDNTNVSTTTAIGGGGTTLGRGEVELFVSTTATANTNNPTPRPPSGYDGRNGGIGAPPRVRRAATIGWHTDFQENFTIQLSGSKRWTLRRGRVCHPLTGTTPHFALRDYTVVENQLKAARLCSRHPPPPHTHTSHSSSSSSEKDDDDGKNDDDSLPSSSSGGYGFAYDDDNAVGDEMTITLYPGDVLYFPAGMWHTVETLEAGISLNVSLMGTSYAKLVCEGLQHLLLGSDDGGWREIVSSRPTSKGGKGDDGIKEMASVRLAPLLAKLGRLVDHFVENQGGARSLLPPALCHPPFPPPPPSLSGTEDDDGGASEEGEDGGRCGSDGSDGGGREEPHDDDDDDGDPSLPPGVVVAIDDFTGPSSWDSSRPTNAKLVRNPLATLMAMSDITSGVGDNNQAINNIDA
ncbi:hypothetical protein ACHAXA_002703 [Cyclostephanos tholiformis]|uniref:JmjC domain-containing protein n=1 Tax=Cyclostephanos tholiformis TaxID=382380 RepID=A0ABD3RAZ2_9STRA